MGSYVIEVDNLESLFKKWVARIKSAGGGKPTASKGDDGLYIHWPQPLVGSETPLFWLNPDLWKSLGDSRFRRIRWFYYCDDARGNTIRLYDSEHFSCHPELYVEKEASGNWLGKNQSWPDRVLFRSNEIGDEGGKLKGDMIKDLNGRIWAATQAPPIVQPHTVNIMRMCKRFFNKRLVYFQHSSRNNTPEEHRSIRYVKCHADCRYWSECSANGIVGENRS